MLNKLKKSDNKGFTIIEVMIVLAIAGLIILIVLLAVPALQRSSRNTSLKNDAAAIAAGVSEFESNNDGTTPNSLTHAAGSSSVTITNTTVASPAIGTAKIQGSDTVTFAGTPAANIGTIVVLFNQKCQASTGFTVIGTNRATAILYNVETSSGVAPRCIDA